MRPSLIPGMRPGAMPPARPGTIPARPTGPLPTTAPPRQAAQPVGRTLMGVPAANIPIPGVMRRWGVWWGVVGSLVKVIGWWRFGLVTIVARRMVSVGVAAVVRVGMVA